MIGYADMISEKREKQKVKSKPMTIRKAIDKAFKGEITLTEEEAKETILLCGLENIHIDWMEKDNLKGIMYINGLNARFDIIKKGNDDDKNKNTKTRASTKK